MLGRETAGGGARAAHLLDAHKGRGKRRGEAGESGVFCDSVETEIRGQNYSKAQKSMERVFSAFFSDR